LELSRRTPQSGNSLIATSVKYRNYLSRIMLQSIVAIASVMMMSANTSFQSVAQSPDNDEWAALKGSGKVLYQFTKV
jgi:hypothetical protein